MFKILLHVTLDLQSARYSSVALIRIKYIHQRRMNSFWRQCYTHLVPTRMLSTRFQRFPFSGDNEVSWLGILRNSLIFSHPQKSFHIKDAYLALVSLGTFIKVILVICILFMSGNVSNVITSYLTSAISKKLHVIINCIHQVERKKNSFLAERVTPT